MCTGHANSWSSSSPRRDGSRRNRDRNALRGLCVCLNGRPSEHAKGLRPASKQMTTDPDRLYRRWQAAETEGREDDADGEFAALFNATAQPQGVGAAFAARTMEAVAAAGAREARRARRL